jgi:hypothetical protein
VTVLDEWASRWGVPAAAVFDLRMRLGIADLPALSIAESQGSESRQQSLVRLDAAQHGVWLTRNNVGALLDDRGVPVRYGLANESKEMNRRVKSGDLIGIRPIRIQQQHVGMLIGQFVSREVKHETWQWKGDSHELAQAAWANFVIAKGGDAAFCTGPGSFNYIGAKS